MRSSSRLTTASIACASSSSMLPRRASSRRASASRGRSRAWKSRRSAGPARGFAAQRVGEVRFGEPHAGLVQVLAQRAHDRRRRAPRARRCSTSRLSPSFSIVARPHPEEQLGDARLRLGDRPARRRRRRAHRTSRSTAARRRRGVIVYGRSSTTVTSRCSSTGITSDSTQRRPRPVQLRCARPRRRRCGSSRIARSPSGSRRSSTATSATAPLRRAPRPGTPGGNASRQRPERVDARPPRRRASTSASCSSSTQPRASGGELGLERGGVDVGRAARACSTTTCSRAITSSVTSTVKSTSLPPNAAAQRVDDLPTRTWRRVAVAREVHEARHEAAELGRGSRTGAPAGAGPCATIAERELGELVGGEPEQLVARVGLEHVRRARARRDSSGAKPDRAITSATLRRTTGIAFGAAL